MIEDVKMHFLNMVICHCHVNQTWILFFKNLFYLAKHFSSPGNPPPKKWTIIFWLLQQPNRATQKIGDSAAAVIPCWHILILHLTIGLIDHRKALAQGFEASKNIIIGNTVFPPWHRKGENVAVLTFFCFFRHKAGNGKKNSTVFVKEAPLSRFWGIMIFLTGIQS